MPVRNRPKAEQAVAAIKAEQQAAAIKAEQQAAAAIRAEQRAATGATGTAEPVLLDLDLARLGTVDALAAHLRANEPRIDVAVLNAGTVLLGDRERHLTEDGHELHLQTNLLGHVALIRGILPLLRASRTRVVVQLSLAAGLSRIDWSDPQTTRRYRALRAYGRSKLALALFATALAAREPDLTVALCHPGIAPGTGIAPIVRDRLPPRLVEFAVRRLGNPPERAARAALMAMDAASSTPPVYVGPRGFLQLAGEPRRLRPRRRLIDPVEAERMWRWTERLLEHG